MHKRGKNYGSIPDYRLGWPIRNRISCLVVMKTKLSSKNLLAELQNPEYHGILDEFRPKFFAKDTFIFGPSGNDDLVFIVKSGQVRISLALFGMKELSPLDPGRGLVLWGKQR